MSSRRSEDHVSRRRRRGGTVETVGRVLEGVINRNNTSTARPGCQRRRGCCYYLTHSRDSTSGRHAPYPVNLHTNTAQGDEHGNLPSAESWSYEGGERRTAETKFERQRFVLNRAECFDTHTQALVGLFAPLLDYDMDALKSAGRAIIRSPSIAKQSWGAGRHKSKYSPSHCTHVLSSSWC